MMPSTVPSSIQRRNYRRLITGKRRIPTHSGTKPPEKPGFGKGSRGDGEVYCWHQANVQFYSFDAAYLERLRSRHRDTEDHFGDYFTVVLRMKLHASHFSSTDADDVIQETLCRVLKTIRDGQIIYPERLGAYVYEVCRNVEREWWRDNKKLWLKEDIDNFDFPDHRSRPDDGLRQAEALTAVAEILSRMSGKDREILIAVFLHERDREEVCQEFGVGREYLRVLVHRAIQNARKSMPREKHEKRFSYDRSSDEP